MHVRGDAVSGTWPQEAHRQPQIERTDAQLEILEKDSVTKPVKIMNSDKLEQVSGRSSVVKGVVGASAGHVQFLMAQRDRKFLSLAPPTR